MSGYPKVTKRELNQQTAKVLNQVRERGAILITEHGVPRWRIEAIESIEDPLERLRAAGQIREASPNPPPWPEPEPGPARYSSERVDELYRWQRGDR